jgi:hypothetical protein
MKRLSLGTAVLVLALSAVACSSSGSKSSSGSSTQKLTASQVAALKNVCEARSQFVDLVQNVGSTPADFQNDATKMKQIATLFTTDAPAFAQKGAQETADAINAAATKVAAAKDATAAKQQINVLVFPDPTSELSKLANTAKTYCKK